MPRPNRSELVETEDFDFSSALKIDKNTIRGLFTYMSLVFFIMIFFAFIFYPIKYSVDMDVKQLGVVDISGINNSISAVIYILLLIAESIIFIAICIVYGKKNIELSILSIVVAFGFLLDMVPYTLYGAIQSLGENIIYVAIPIVVMFMVIKYRLKNSYVFVGLLILNYLLYILPILPMLGSTYNYENVYMFAMMAIIFVISIIPERK